MIALTVAFWRAEVKSTITYDPAVSSQQYLEDFLRKSIDNGIKVTVDSDAADERYYILSFSDPNYETLFRIKYGDYL